MTDAMVQVRLKKNNTHMVTWLVNTFSIKVGNKIRLAGEEDFWLIEETWTQADRDAVDMNRKARKGLSSIQ